MFGAVPLATVADTCGSTTTRTTRPGRDAVLTNCAFDGIVCDVQRVMHGCLAIRTGSRLAFGRGVVRLRRLPPIYRRRTAIAAARLGRVTAVPSTPGIAAARAAGGQHELARSGPRQGSDSGVRHPVHPPDTDRASAGVDDPRLRRSFQHLTESTSTRPTSRTRPPGRLPILASLDVGRRQARLEGYQLVQRQAELAVSAWTRSRRTRDRRESTRFLATPDIIPAGTAYPASTSRSRKDFLPGWSGLATRRLRRDPSHLTL